MVHACGYQCPRRGNFWVFIIRPFFSVILQFCPSTDRLGSACNRQPYTFCYDCSHQELWQQKLVGKWLALVARGSFIPFGMRPDPRSGTLCQRGQSHCLSSGRMSDCTFVPVTSPPPGVYFHGFQSSEKRSTSNVAIELSGVHLTFIFLARVPASLFYR